MTQVYKDVQITADHKFLSCDMNSASLSFDADQLENTNFCTNGAKTYQQGMMDISGEFQGFWTPETEDYLRSAGDDPIAWTLTPTAAPGARSYVFTGPVLNLNILGAVGELFPISGSFAHGAAFTEGTFMGSPDVTTTEAFTSGVQLGEIGSGETKTFLVINHGDEDVDVIVQSSASNGWSSPTARITETADASSVNTYTYSTATTNAWWRIGAETDSGTSKLTIISL